MTLGAKEIESVCELCAAEGYPYNEETCKDCTDNPHKRSDDMDEYISKQKVLDYLNGYLHSLGDGGADTLDTLADTLFDRGQRRALINSMQDISAVKAADFQSVNQWISVKDRLPDDHKDVLVWFEYFRYGDYNRLYQRYGIGNYVDKMWYINGEAGWRQLRVIAWQKLPNPPESEE